MITAQYHSMKNILSSKLAVMCYVITIMGVYVLWWWTMPLLALAGHLAFFGMLWSMRQIDYIEEEIYSDNLKQ